MQKDEEKLKRRKNLKKLPKKVLETKKIVKKQKKSKKKITKKKLWIFQEKKNEKNKVCYIKHFILRE